MVLNLQLLSFGRLSSSLDDRGVFPSEVSFSHDFPSICYLQLSSAGLRLFARSLTSKIFCLLSTTSMICSGFTLRVVFSEIYIIWVILSTHLLPTSKFINKPWEWKQWYFLLLWRHNSWPVLLYSVEFLKWVDVTLSFGPCIWIHFVTVVFV